VIERGIEKKDEYVERGTAVLGSQVRPTSISTRTMSNGGEVLALRMVSDSSPSDATWVENPALVSWRTSTF
jgi:hypothetical protein